MVAFSSDLGKVRGPDRDIYGIHRRSPSDGMPKVHFTITMFIL